MFRRYQNPIQQGTAVLPNVMQAPPLVHIEGVQRGSPEANAVMQRFMPTVSAFVRGQRQNQEVSGRDVVRTQRDVPGLRMIYTRLHGQEIITLLPSAAVLRDVRRAPPQPRQDVDIVLDGYIAFANQNRVTDDNLELIINGQSMGVMDFTPDEQVTTYVFVFGRLGLRIPGPSAATESRLPEAPLPPPIPEADTPEERRFSYYDSFDDTRTVIAGVRYVPDFLPLNPVGKNEIRLTAVSNNGQGTLGTMSAEFFTRSVGKFRKVSRAYRRADPRGNQTIVLNDWTMYWRYEYRPTLFDPPRESDFVSETMVLDLTPENEAQLTQGDFQGG